MLQDVALYRILVDRLEGSWDLVTRVIKKGNNTYNYL